MFSPKTTKEELLCFLLNKKRGNFMEFSPEKLDDSHDWFELLIFSDKKIKIFYQFNEKNKDERFAIYSDFWGRIKNSHFTLNSEFGKFKEVRCGIIPIQELLEWTPKDGLHYDINKGNDIAKAAETSGEQYVTFADINEVGIYIQKTFKNSLSYEVTRVISQAPYSWVEIEITLPDGRVFFQQGNSKKHAVNQWAKNFKG